MTMIGFPPALADRWSLSNWQNAPHNRWAFQHLREVVPTARVGRGSAGAATVGTRRRVRRAAGRLAAGRSLRVGRRGARRHLHRRFPGPARRQGGHRAVPERHGARPHARDDVGVQVRCRLRRRVARGQRRHRRQRRGRLLRPGTRPVRLPRRHRPGRPRHAIRHRLFRGVPDPGCRGAAAGAGHRLGTPGAAGAADVDVRVPVDPDRRPRPRHRVRVPVLRDGHPRLAVRAGQRRPDARAAVHADLVADRRRTGHGRGRRSGGCRLP